MGYEQKHYAVNVSKEAAEMLNDHISFLAKVSIEAAEKLVDDVNEAFDSLKIMPNRCPKFRTKNTDGVYRQLIIGRYKLIFSVNEKGNTVEIKYILDSRQSNEI